MLTTPIKWQGSKCRMRGNIRPIIQRANYDIYVEPFGGGGGMFTGIKNPPNVEEVYNDLNNAVANFFLILRDKAAVNEIKTLCDRSLYSRRYWTQCKEVVLDHFAGNYDLAREGLRVANLDKYDEKVALAFCFFYVQNAGYGGCFANSFGSAGKPHVRKRGGSVWEQAARFRHKVDLLGLFFERFKLVTVENLPYEVILEKFDTPTTLFYCDPPYWCQSTKHYLTKWQADTEQDFITRIAALKGSVIVSCYDTPRYEALLEKGFTRKNFKGLASLNDRTPKQSIETVYYKLNERPKCLENTLLQ